MHAPDGVRAVPLLEDEHDDPVRGHQGDEVQDDRLDRQQDRAERTGEQDECQQHDEPEHVREVRVDRRYEVAVLARPSAIARLVSPDSS